MALTYGTSIQRTPSTAYQYTYLAPPRTSAGTRALIPEVPFMLETTIISPVDGSTNYFTITNGSPDGETISENSQKLYKYIIPTSSVTITLRGFQVNRFWNKWYQILTLTKVQNDFTGPIMVQFANLANTQLVNASGYYQGYPYILVDMTDVPVGGTATFIPYYNPPVNSAITYQATFYTVDYSY